MMTGMVQTMVLLHYVVVTYALTILWKAICLGGRSDKTIKGFQSLSMQF